MPVNVLIGLELWKQNCNRHIIQHWNHDVTKHFAPPFPSKYEFHSCWQLRSHWTVIGVRNFHKLFPTIFIHFQTTNSGNPNSPTGLKQPLRATLPVVAASGPWKPGRLSWRLDDLGYPHGVETSIWIHMGLSNKYRNNSGFWTNIGQLEGIEVTVLWNLIDNDPDILLDYWNMLQEIPGCPHPNMFLSWNRSLKCQHGLQHLLRRRFVLIKDLQPKIAGA